MATTTTNLDQAARAIQALEADFARRANGTDMRALAEAYYTDDAILLPPGTPPVRGKQAISQFFQGMHDAGSTDVVLTPHTIRSSGDLVYSVGDYSHKMAGQAQEGKYLVVYQRQADGSYRAIADSFSPNA